MREIVSGCATEARRSGTEVVVAPRAAAAREAGGVETAIGGLSIFEAVSGARAAGGRLASIRAERIAMAR
ncbi:MAG: hypothetical protein AAF909_14250 [Pseudomonadota bacterium]